MLQGLKTVWFCIVWSRKLRKCIFFYGRSLETAEWLKPESFYLLFICFLLVCILQTSFELLTTLFLVYFPKPKMSNDELIIIYVNLILFFRFRFEPTHKRLNINFIFFKSFKLEGKYFHCHLDWYRIWTEKESCHVYGEY